MAKATIKPHWGFPVGLFCLRFVHVFNADMSANKPATAMWYCLSLILAMVICRRSIKCRASSLVIKLLRGPFSFQPSLDSSFGDFCCIFSNCLFSVFCSSVFLQISDDFIEFLPRIIMESFMLVCGRVYVFFCRSLQLHQRLDAGREIII